MWNCFDNEIIKNHVEMLELEKFDSDGYILDIGGGGEGAIGRLMGERTIAIDLHMSELAEAPDGFLKIVMDASDLMFPDETFGNVTAFFSLTYVKDEPTLKAVFEEAYRVLKTGYKFRIWDIMLPTEIEEGKKAALYTVDIKIGDEVINTGYGSPLRQPMRYMEHYIKLAEDAGFIVEKSEKGNNSIYIELLKQ